LQNCHADRNSAKNCCLFRHLLIELAYKFGTNLCKIISSELHAVKISAKSHFRGTIMKRAIFVGVAISALLIAAPLSAADVALRAPVAPTPVATWTGCYVGGNAGEAWANSSMVLQEFGALPENSPLGTASGSGWAFGGQIGCDYQVNNSWVFGLRAMWDGARVNGSTSGILGSGSLIPNFTTNSFATAIGRVGYSPTPTLLFYGLGGVASVQDQYSVGTTTAVGGNLGTIGIARETRTGWDAGAGVSWMFNPNWDLWFEYDYMDFGRNNVFFTGTGAGVGVPEILDIRQTVQALLVGVDYRFGGAR
jgi:outer membrane immunogenic protein